MEAKSGTLFLKDNIILLKNLKGHTSDLSDIIDNKLRNQINMQNECTTMSIKPLFTIVNLKLTICQSPIVNDLKYIVEQTYKQQIEAIKVHKRLKYTKHHALTQKNIRLLEAQCMDVFTLKGN